MDKFTQKIKAFSERVSALYKQADGAALDNPHHAKGNSLAPSGERSDWMPAILEELQTALEELRVAEEELRTQNDALLASQEVIEAERQRYHDLFEFAPDGYLVTDINGTIQEANRAAARMFNVEQRFLVGKPLVNFIGGESTEVEVEARRAFRSVLLKLCQGDLVIGLNRDAIGMQVTPQEWEVQLYPRQLDKRPETEPGRQTRQCFDAALTVAPIFSHTGKVIALRWLIRDITARKQAEAEVRTLNAELEQRVRDRTAELEAANKVKDELLLREQAARAVSERAQRAAEAANRMKDEFLAILSHELRTPLNAMLGWSQLLRTRTLNEATMARALETIERNAKLQSQLIKDLLDVSRIVRGKLAMRIVPCELAAVVKAAIDTIRPAAEAKRIDLRTNLDPTLGLMAVDPDRLQQVVWNLVSNAIKFTPPGGQVAVQVTRKTEPSGVVAQIQISDTGTGISPEFLPYIFDRFRQGESHSARNHGGLGLGLAIVRHIVELHGGTVEAKSLGKHQGTTFWVKLPQSGVADIPPETGNEASTQIRMLH